MLDAHIIAPDALYTVSYASSPPCIPDNWDSYSYAPKSPVQCNTDSGRFSFSPTLSPSPANTRLQRGKGPWRDPGFWLRLVSPGGTKHLRRRGHRLNTSDAYSAALSTSVDGDVSRRTKTLPRSLKYSSDTLTPKKSLSPLSPCEKTPREFFHSPARSFLLWDKFSLTPLKENWHSKLDSHTSSPTKYATLPRDVRCDLLVRSPLNESKANLPPWWSKVLSPLSPRRIGRRIAERQKLHPWKEDVILEWVEGNEGKKHRGVSLRRLSRSRLANERPAPTSDSNATQSDTELGKISGPAIRISNGGLSNDTSVEMSRVGVWASSFEKLIDDPAGLHTFAEFLKKEYSHENIYFWTACERYKMIEDDEERRQVARTIFNRHLGVGAPEPVNVDSQARQVAQEGLADPDEFLFSAAQKQIYNLMKFDSYSRFLKSDLYNSCLSQERKGLPLPFPGDDTLDPDLGIFSDSNFYKHLKKSRSDADERRRKSLLPWHRKDRSKSKDRGEAEYWRRKKLGHHSTSESSSARSDLTDSHTSLNSSDFAPGRRAISKESLTSADAISLSGAEGFSLCRFFLPDQSNSVVAVRSGETVKELVRQLLERRRINFTAFNVVLVKEDKMVDVNKDSAVLRGKEARVERMVLFSLFLPSRKTVYVKAKPHKLISEVLKPILTKYGLKIELMVIFKSGATKGINLKSTVTDFDGEKLIIQTKEEIKEWSDPARQSKRNSNLDEITNRVFEDLLNGKTQSSFDDLGVLDFDARSIKTDPTSETSSSLLESFSRRESLSLERNPESKPSGSRRVLQNSGMSKLRNNHDLTARTRQENADLYEGLKRAQMSRLDDQRGTEINFELPDFLKTDSNPGGSLLSHFERSFHSTASDSIHQNEFLSRAHPEVWGGHPCSSADTTLVSPPDLDLDDLEETLRPSSDMVKASADTEKENRLGGGDNNANSRQDVTPSPFPFSRNHVSSPSPFLTPPPPLPPKPKLGGPLRGPPPRPPSRQPTPLSHALHLLDNHDHLINHSRQSLDKFSVSFV